MFTADVAPEMVGPLCDHLRRGKYVDLQVTESTRPGLQHVAARFDPGAKAARVRVPKKLPKVDLDAIHAAKTAALQPGARVSFMYYPTKKYRANDQDVGRSIKHHATVLAPLRDGTVRQDYTDKRKDVQWLDVEVDGDGPLPVYETVEFDPANIEYLAPALGESPDNGKRTNDGGAAHVPETPPAPEPVPGIITIKPWGKRGIVVSDPDGATTDRLLEAVPKASIMVRKEGLVLSAKHEAKVRAALADQLNPQAA